MSNQTAWVCVQRRGSGNQYLSIHADMPGAVWSLAETITGMREWQLKKAGWEVVQATIAIDEPVGAKGVHEEK